MNEPSARTNAARRQQWLGKVDDAMRAFGRPRAAQLALEAVRAGVEHPSLLNLAASLLHGEGRFEEAVGMLDRARALAPKDPNILNSLGICLKAQGRLDAALEAYEAALRIEPAMAAAHFNRGVILENLNDINGSRAAYEKAAAIDGSYVEPLASLAWLDAQAGDSRSARANADRALAISQANVLARMALASADLQQASLSDASAKLFDLIHDPALSPVNRSIVLGLIGDLLDAEGRPAEAFAAYSASNAELKALNAMRFESPGEDSPIANAKRLIAWFETADPAPWRETAKLRGRAGDPKAHIFLVGFPRSGTTLLENVLAAHPDVVSLEEKDSLALQSAKYLASSDGLERLARIAPGEAARQRDAYWSTVRSFGVEPRGRVFIDKMPLASVALPLIAKLFPDSRILFARRDPRDVVLSCFRRRFGMNPSMYQLLTLEGAAEYYDAVMRLSEIYRELLPLPQHIVRYESLVEEFEGSAGSACDFLGLEWDAHMLDFAAQARTRGISTPSAAQVARGLNRKGKGAWRRYRAEIEPVLPILEPWIRRFGYEA